MVDKLSLVMITKNSDELLEKSLKSVSGLINEIIIVDSCSTDRTLAIAKKFRAKIFMSQEEDLGEKRSFALKKAKNEWVLALDADEIITPPLKEEINKVIASPNYDGFCIPYQNHFLGQPVNRGGENYQVLRLFKKNKVLINPSFVHEKYLLKDGQLGYLAGKINHYSYRSFKQIFLKFTDYAKREAKRKKQQGEKASLREIFLNPPHMFWARFIEDKGYQDGIFRLPLDLAFAYMEFLTYFLLFFKA